VLERKAPPTFDTVIEIEDIAHLAIHHNVAEAVDRLLLGGSTPVEVRYKGALGEVLRQGRSVILTGSAPPAEQEPGQLELPDMPPRRASAGRIFAHGLSRRKVEKALQELGSPAVVTRDPQQADLILALEARLRRDGVDAPSQAQVLTVRSNTYVQIKEALREVAQAAEDAREAFALREAQQAVEAAQAGEGPVELLPQNSYLRRLQHELVGRHHLVSHSVGREPRRRVVVMGP